LAERLLKNVNRTSILVFNAIFEEGELYRAFGNNPFQAIMNYIVEELHLLSLIFEFLEKNERGDVHDIVKTIKFASSKCSVKINVTQKYLRTLARFPELYECLLSNEGYNKIQEQMQSVIDLLRAEPNTPFHLMRTTFFKANFKHLSEYSKQPNLLVKGKEDYSLRSSPDSLDWYEELISLMEDTPNELLRH
jgi:hypothetical protein